MGPPRETPALLLLPLSFFLSFFLSSCVLPNRYGIFKKGFRRGRSVSPGGYLPLFALSYVLRQTHKKKIYFAAASSC
jgi:hypothetical protein